MTWTCPKCNRKFARINQSHSCERHAVEEHFIRRATWLRTLYEALLGHVDGFGPYRVEAVKAAILLKRETAFASVKVQKECLQISFALDEELDEFPVYKTLQYSKNKWGHAVKIDSIEDLDSHLLGLLKRAYLLEGG